MLRVLTLRDVITTIRVFGFSFWGACCMLCACVLWVTVESRPSIGKPSVMFCRSSSCASLKWSRAPSGTTSICNLSGGVFQLNQFQGYIVAVIVRVACVRMNETRSRAFGILQGVDQLPAPSLLREHANIWHLNVRCVWRSSYISFALPFCPRFHLCATLLG